MRLRFPRGNDGEGGETDDASFESRLVWIFGSPRTGSTWLLNLLRNLDGVVGINEPAIGAHLGTFAPGLIGTRPRRAPEGQPRLNDLRADSPDYFFSDPYAHVWRPLARDLVLGRLGAQAQAHAERRSLRDPLVVVKEPNGSHGADVVMSLLPRSRMIFLLRDGRDVLDSELDAVSQPSWVETIAPGYEVVAQPRDEYLVDRAHVWLSRTVAVQHAYEHHPAEHRMLVRYEDLLDDPEPILASITAWAGIDADRDSIREAVEKLSFDRIPAEERGSGKFTRAATPGLWRENLSKSEQRLVEEIIGPKLRELGYE